jgi:DamX protein
MNEHTSTSSSSYVISYGMSREPFGDAIEDDLFYAEPARKQKLDILLHLTQYGNELMLVTGPEGSGKTTLLQQFQLHALDTWKIARIEAKNGIDERKLVQQLFHQMGLEFHGASHAELLEHLEHHFDSLQHSARQAVMLIDDAEQLPVTALKRVLELASLTSKTHKPLLRIILFGTGKLEENFSDPLLGSFSHIVRHNIELPAFDSEHTAHYIFHRLSAAHGNDNKPFSESTLNRIHKQSQGWPGKINQLAHNRLIEASLAATPGNATSTFNVPRAIAALIGITLISALLFFQDEFNQWLDGTENQTTAAQQQAIVQHLHLKPESEPKKPAEATTESTIMPSVASPTIAATSTTEPPVDTSMDDFTATVKETESAQQMTLATDKTPTTEKQESPFTPPATPSTDAKALLGDTAKPALVTASPDSASAVMSATTIAATTDSMKRTATDQLNLKTGSPATAKPQTPPAEIPIDLPGYRENWILKQNPEHYTLQLVAGKNVDTLRQFIQEHALSESIALYRSTRKNQPWYGLVYRTFPNKQAAIDARSRLPKSLQRLKPWVRNLGALQKELRKTHTAL